MSKFIEQDIKRPLNIYNLSKEIKTTYNNIARNSIFLKEGKLADISKKAIEVNMFYLNEIVKDCEKLKTELEKELKGDE